MLARAKGNWNRNRSLLVSFIIFLVTIIPIYNFSSQEQEKRVKRKRNESQGKKDQKEQASLTFLTPNSRFCRDTVCSSICGVLPSAHSVAVVWVSVWVIVGFGVVNIFVECTGAKQEKLKCIPNFPDTRERKFTLSCTHTACVITKCHKALHGCKRACARKLLRLYCLLLQGPTYRVNHVHGTGMYLVR